MEGRDHIQMAREVGITDPSLDKVIDMFARLVRVDECKECMNICENITDFDDCVDDYYSDIYVDAINKRKEKWTTK